MNIRKFAVNSAVLTGTTILLRLTNIWFRVYICTKIGSSGMGLYQLTLSVFSLAVAVSTSGAGLTVTRLVAEGCGTAKGIRRCVLFSVGVSLAAGGVLFLGSDGIARHLLHAESGLPLRLLAPGLPFMAVCACLKGYFLARRDSTVPALAEALEQLVTIGAAAALFAVLTPFSALMLASTVGEAASCCVVALVYLRRARRQNGLSRAKDVEGYGRILHIAMPVLAGAFVRNLLSSTENLLIPGGLRRNGADAGAALAQYGVIQGMVMPILLFPSSFLASLSSLLIPELAEANALGRRGAIRKSASRAFRFTLFFSFLIVSVLIVFAEDLGMAFYGNAQAGEILRIMAPIIPILYLDSVVDGMLKGLDQQAYSFRYNLADSILRVVFIAVMLPLFGIRAYLCLLFLSEIFNASFSINRLLKVARVRVNVIEWIVGPAVCAGLLYYLLVFLRGLSCAAAH